MPSTVESRSECFVNHLFGQSGRIDDHGVLPAGLGDEFDDLAIAQSERPIDGDAGVGAAGEHDAVNAGIADQSRADNLAIARNDVQHVWRNAGPMHEPYCAGGDERRLLGRLGHHGIACGERPGDLASENGQWEVPGRDRREHAAGVQRELVLSPVGPLSSRGEANSRCASAAE